jgi:hypothetical protein
MSRRLFVAAGLVFLGFGGAVLLMVKDVPWADRIDFDVAGILWLLMNIPKLSAWLVAGVFGAVAVYFFVRALGLGGATSDRMNMRAEEGRLMADPRFQSSLGYSRREDMSGRGNG